MVKMNIALDDIRSKAPEGATHYNDEYGFILYFIKSSYGFRQIKGNIINFHCSGVSNIKPL
jgi:hypothetical protein